MFFHCFFNVFPMLDLEAYTFTIFPLPGLSLLFQCFPNARPWSVHFYDFSTSRFIFGRAPRPHCSSLRCTFLHRYHLHFYTPLALFNYDFFFSKIKHSARKFQSGRVVRRYYARSKAEIEIDNIRDARGAPHTHQTWFSRFCTPRGRHPATAAPE